MVAQTSQPSSRTSSITERSSQHPLSLKMALKKPFQGWSKDLLRARDNDDDEYNFSSGSCRGAQYFREDAYKPF
ncbi:hypothetical protein BDW02DRAFT_495030 [Decorospora gaudefroyi]|uniref:Uncharacterized protein n=1 Tax=Decorospora gaudefroyi TaxID=184978 RepID=A0A6A5KFL7_9PLEO|nr:hypothetical protein BDW02DRAFT_495030 [Decorospora gaudefroyi]